MTNGSNEYVNIIWPIQTILSGKLFKEKCPVSVLTDTNGVIKVLPPKTAEEILARERERKARTTLLMDLPEDHLVKFYEMTDAKEMWDAIKSRFCENDELKKMQNCPQLDHEDLEHLDEFDLEEMDLKWQVAMISMRMKKFYKKTGRKLQFDAKEPVSQWRNKDSRRRDIWNTGNKDKENRRRSGKQEDSKALVTLDGEGVDWTSHSEDEQENYALMACSSSGSDTEREQLGDASIEIQAYTQALKKVEAQLVAHQQSQLCQMSARDKVGLSEETHKSMPEPVVNEPKVVSQPKVWLDAPIIEEYESDSEDEHVSLPTKEQETPSFAFINTVKHVKTPRQTVKEQNTYSQSPKPDKKDCSGLMSKKLGLGYGYTKKACFVCGSFCHLIRDCDFHEKRMAKQAELNNRMSKGSGQREIRPVWNNVQRLNHQNQFVPKAVLTRTGKIQVNTARTSVLTSTIPIIPFQPVLLMKDTSKDMHVEAIKLEAVSASHKLSTTCRYATYTASADDIGNTVLLLDIQLLDYT
ncbi:hypothetical protein Tco_0150293 [Tanacetum coccineum]